MNAGWFADPTGRFPARYYDGSDWTDHVQGADGQVSVDAMERRSSGYNAPGAAPSPTGHAPGAAPTWGAPGAAPTWGAPGPTGPSGAGLDRSSGNLGLGLAGFGWLLAVISFFGLDWVEGGTRADIVDGLADSLPSGVPLADAISYHYLSWMSLGLLALVTVGLVVVGAGLRKADPTGPRLAVAAIAAVAAVLQAEMMVRTLRDSAEVGAQLGIVAFLLVVAGLAIGSRTARAA